jgi:hypothetical protein
MSQSNTALLQPPEYAPQRRLNDRSNTKADITVARLTLAATGTALVSDQGSGRQS